VAEAGEDVDVDVDESGREVEAGDVDGLLRRSCRDRWFDGGDLAITDGYVAFGVDIVLRVEDVAVAEDEIVLLRLRRESAGEEDKKVAKHGGSIAKHRGSSPVSAE
jgi:hypothetical protein